MEIRAYVNLLSESVSTEYDLHQKVSHLLGCVIRYFMASPSVDDFRFVKDDGTAFVELLGWQLGFPEEDYSLRLRLMCDPTLINPNGSFVKSKLKQFVRLRMPGKPISTFDDMDRVGRDVVHDRNIHQVLKHEFAHYIDSKRFDFDETKYVPYDEDATEYYNTPVEFNAYYHIAVDRLMTCLHQMTRTPTRCQHFADIFGIAADFQTTMERVINKPASPYVQSFLKTLNDRNRRSYLKRVYRLHQEILSLMRANGVTV